MSYKVLIVGDIIFDQYTYVTAERVAPEAPIPVWDEKSSELRLGGAANVAHNLTSLGGTEVEVHLAGIVGSKMNETIFMRAAGINTDMCLGSSTMVKRRFVDERTKSYLFRVDNFKQFDHEDVLFFESVMSGYVHGRTFDAVVVSDYNKGTVTQRIADLVRSSGKLSIVDSKRRDLSRFDKYQILKINREEFGRAASHDPIVESLFQHVIVTNGDKGAQVRQYEKLVGRGTKKYAIHSENFPVVSAKKIDVTGCGDTHTAAVTLEMLRTGDVRSSVKFANECARSVVEKFGTSVPHRT